MSPDSRRRRAVAKKDQFILLWTEKLPVQSIVLAAAPLRESLRAITVDHCHRGHNRRHEGRRAIVLVQRTHVAAGICPEKRIKFT